MPAKKYRVKLTETEQKDLQELISQGKAAARKLVHARILLHTNENSETEGLKDTDVANAVCCSRLTVERVRKRFVEEGIDSALNPKVQKRHRTKKLDGKGEAFLIATACSTAPEGRSDWTLQLLANRLIECNIVDSITGEAVRQILKKTNSNRG